MANDAGAAGRPDQQTSYDAQDITVLEGLEAVRLRPGMYIGGTDESALHHLAAEILDNSMDEAVAGHASFIEVSVEEGNWLTVRDNGRGIIGHSGQLPDGPYGAGIPAMRARLQDVGGRFRLFSGKGGTLIVGMIPIIPDATGTDSSYDSRLWDMHATPLIPV